MSLARFFRQLQRLDWILLLAVLVLFGFGMAAIYSVELSRESAEFLLLRKQGIAFAIGIVLLVVSAGANYLQLRNYGRLLYLIGIGLMVLVLIFGSTIRGTTGWFVLFGVSFQPVEFMKLALAVELARYFGEHARRQFGWREIFGSGLLTCVPVFLTAIQPDLGSAMLMLGMWGLLVFFAGLRLRQGAILAIVVIAIAIFGWFFLLQPYQKQRVEVFLDPSLDPLEKGYNVTQSRIAIGSGQLFGRGLGFGSQSQLKFLPESQTDFVFAVIAEELGFFGVMIIFFAIGVFMYRSITLSRHARDNFTGFLAIALSASVFVQAMVNIGVNLALLPATGVALPFVSYGGSSLVFSLLMVGILESIAVRERPADIAEKKWYTTSREG